MYTHKKPAPAARGRRSIALFLAADILAAALLVFGNYYFLYEAPIQGLGGASIPLPQVQNNIQHASHQQLAETAGDVPEQTQPLSLRDKFAEHFTDTVVSTDTTYSSPDLSVEVTQHTQGSGNDTVTYYVADVYMADLSSFQTGSAGGAYNPDGQREHLNTMSQRVGAILAMNGDSYCYNHQHTAGSLIRNGVVYRAEPTSSDVCILYRDGVMRTYSPGQFDLKQAVQDGAYQSWTFGPRLLDDQGRAMTEFNTWDYIRESHPRSAVGYYEPGHYCFLVADGRSAQSSGMTLQEMSLVFEKLGCAAAYNLDGGHSAFLAFQGQVVNHPYRSSHQITDCLYFGEVP